MWSIDSNLWNVLRARFLFMKFSWGGLTMNNCDQWIQICDLPEASVLHQHQWVTHNLHLPSQTIDLFLWRLYTILRLCNVCWTRAGIKLKSRKSCSFVYYRPDNISSWWLGGCSETLSVIFDLQLAELQSWLPINKSGKILSSLH